MKETRFGMRYVLKMVASVVKHVKMKLVETDMSHQHTSSSLPLKRMATFLGTKIEGKTATLLASNLERLGYYTAVILF